MMGINPYHCVELRIKLGIAPQHIHGDAVFFKLVTFAIKIFIAEIAQQTRELGGAFEYLRSQHACKFRSLLFPRRLVCGFPI